MAGLNCTCSDIRMLKLEGEPICPIHNERRIASPPESFLRAENGMLLVCVCEEDCHSCKYTKLSDLIKHGIPFKAYYSDSTNRLQPIKRLVKDDETTPNEKSA